MLYIAARVVVCQYVRQLALGLPLTFSQRDIPAVRLRICSDLLDGAREARNERVLRFVC